MYGEWPFYRTMLDNAALALARTDMEVTGITGRESVLGGGWLAESLQRHNPYVDPLNFLQVSLLGTDDRTDPQERVPRPTVKGIAAGMKNTG